MERDRKDTRCKESALLVGFFAVAHSLTPLTEGARVQIDLPQDGLQVVASSRVLLRERILGRKMSPAAIREYNMNCFGKPGHVMLFFAFVLVGTCVSQKAFSLEKSCNELYRLIGI